MKDEIYKNTLAKHLKTKSSMLTENIVGETEFKEYLQVLDEKSYMPGKRLSLDKVDSFDDSGIDNGDFEANLHIHTTNSDGLGSVKQILDNAVTVSHKLKHNKSFLLSITDHDTIDGAVEAMEFLTSSNKYSSLKLALGLEVSTVLTQMPDINKTLDIHVLFYCYNPFDERLNTFLEDKQEKKLKLAKNTLFNLNEELSEVLDKLEITLSLEEAAKIHPMILKGEDEVSHPLKKYVYGKLLFAYYIENNSELLKKLQNAGMTEDDLSYEKVVHKFKGMFNNERYFYIYREALEKFINASLEPIPLWLEQGLLEAKRICEKSHPSKNNFIDAFSEFEDTIKFLSSLNYGLLSIAHPARINIKNENITTEEFFFKFFSLFKNAGSSRAYAYEKYYLSYTGKRAFSYLPAIDSTADILGLSHTGGIDSHGYSVSRRCPYS